MNPNESAGLPSSGRAAWAERALSVARVIFLLLTVGLFLVPPWAFGGMGPEGYFWIVWTGRLCAVPLSLWIISRILRRRWPRGSFWVAIICWGLLAGQIWLSTQNRSHLPMPPWEGGGFTPAIHDESWPSTAFRGGTQNEAQLWIAFGLLALTARTVGLRSKQVRGLLWVLVTNTTVLAVIGVPFKYSGEKKILGKWDAPEWYYYSTFLYHNHWCAFALLAVAAAIALVATYKNAWLRGTLLTAAALIAASAPLAISRLGTLAMLAFVSAAAVLAWRWRKSGEHARVSVAGRLKLLAGVVLTLAVVAGGVVAILGDHRQAGGHRSWSGLLNQNPFGIRQTLFEDSLPMIAEKPWFGWGLGAYGAAFRYFQRDETKGGVNGARVTLYEHAHNDWIERWAELGWVGMLLLLLPGTVWVLSRMRRPIPMSEIERWLFTGCIALLIFALGDMAFVNRTVAAAFAVLFPLALNARNPRKRIRETP